MRRPILPQPAIFGTSKDETPCHPLSRGDFTTVLRPMAFFWFRGKLFVGHNWLSSLHIAEEPVWDPKPVPVGTRIEDCNGYIDFVEIRREGPPYYRAYAVLRLKHRYKPDDSHSGNPVLNTWRTGKKFDQGAVMIDEQHVLFPNCFMQLTWNGAFDGGKLIAPHQIDDFKAEVTQHELHWDKHREKCETDPNYNGECPPYPRRKYCGYYTPHICMCHKWSGDGENRLQRILRSSSLDMMRYDPRAVTVRKREHPKGCARCKF